MKSTISADRTRFHSSVTVIIPGKPWFHLISSVEEADQFLFENWGSYDSEQWMKAMDQCAKATMGTANAEDVRAAFLSAMDNAGMETTSVILLP
jgi:Protein of unknown function (DUF982)